MFTVEKNNPGTKTCSNDSIKSPPVSSVDDAGSGALYNAAYRQNQAYAVSWFSVKFVISSWLVQSFEKFAGVTIR
jgi:hypothetical protein